MEATMCEVCHRALYVKDGPICPECLLLIPEIEPEAEEPEEDEA